MRNPNPRIEAGLTLKDANAESENASQTELCNNARENKSKTRRVDAKTRCRCRKRQCRRPSYVTMPEKTSRRRGESMLKLDAGAERDNAELGNNA